MVQRFKSVDNRTHLPNFQICIIYNGCDELRSNWVQAALAGPKSDSNAHSMAGPPAHC